MMNSQSIPHALIEHVPLLMHQDHDTGSFRELISAKTCCYSSRCVRTLKLALNQLLKAQGCYIFGETNQAKSKGTLLVYRNALCFGLKSEWVPLRTTKHSNSEFTRPVFAERKSQRTIEITENSMTSVIFCLLLVFPFLSSQKNISLFSGSQQITAFQILLFDKLGVNKLRCCHYQKSFSVHIFTGQGHK